jgi:hypothetical protein
MSAILAKSLLILFLLLGFIGVFLNIYGNFIIFGTALIYAIINNFASLSVKIIVFLGLMAVIGEISEFLSVGVVSKRFGASRKAAIAAVLGAIIGSMVGSILGLIGAILGAFLGIFIAAFIVEIIIKRKMKEALRAGAGGMTGRVFATFFKAAIAIVMCLIILFNVF